MGAGFADDETDGHIDNIACFAAPARVLVGVPAFETSPDRESVRHAMRRLKAARDSKGRALEIVEIPQPIHPRIDWRGRPLNASYINFLFVNGGVLVPMFDDKQDEPALSVFHSLFSDREIVPIEASVVLQGGGGLHCIALAQPDSPGQS